jgi:predicted RNA binding protein YcfA (HicA-like mRNA interferase family)
MADTLNQRQAIRLLQRNGWQREVGGKHAVKMTKEGERPVPLPHHQGRDYGRGLTQSILKQSGIDRINEGKWNSPSRYISTTTKAIGLTSSKSQAVSRQAEH